ncbi:prefoldin subunit beta [Candidatus Heimdallarchaeota archaeon B3_Heim]|nr:MAG: prefoldin subunit beta [Candidatus Heimdallarchaeota archaeon B3_Heim]
MTLPELSPAQQEQLVRYRTLEQNIQNLRIQLNEIERALSEIGVTKKELQNLEGDTEVWKAVGGVMFPKKAQNVLKELTEKGELLEIQKKGLSSQEKQNVERFEELQKKLSQDLG